MFFDDARTAAPILEVVLTSRNKNKEGGGAALRRAAPRLGELRRQAAAQGLQGGHLRADGGPGPGQGHRAPRGHPCPDAGDGAGGGSAGRGAEQLHRRHPPRRRRRRPWPPWTWRVADFEVQAFAAGNDEALFNEFYRKFPTEIVIAREYEEEFALFVKRFPEFASILATVYDDAEFDAADCAAVLRQQFHLESIEGIGLCRAPGRGRRRRRDAQVRALHPPRGAGPCPRPALQRQRGAPGAGRRLVPQPGGGRQPEERQRCWFAVRGRGPDRHAHGPAAAEEVALLPAARQGGDRAAPGRRSRSFPGT